MGVGLEAFPTAWMLTSVRSLASVHAFMHGKGRAKTKRSLATWTAVGGDNFHGGQH
jgi:hypothetical protein